MDLTDADKQKIADWLNAKCGQMRCFCCGASRWQLAPFSTVPIGFDVHSTRFHYHRGIAQVALICTNCAHMLWFSTDVMGFKPDEPKAHQVSEESQEPESGEDDQDAPPPVEAGPSSANPATS